MASLWWNATTHPNVSKSWKVFFWREAKFPYETHLHRDDGINLLDEPPADGLVAKSHLAVPAPFQVVGVLPHLPLSALLPWAPLALTGLQRLNGLLLCNSRLSTNYATNFPDISQSSMEWICKAKTYGILPNIAKLSHQIPLTWLSISPIFTCCLSVRLSANLSSPTIRFFFIIYTITYEILRQWHQL